MGDILGANFDPSHLIWQGMDPVMALRELEGGAVYHFHAKDTKVDRLQQGGKTACWIPVARTGDLLDRSWVFRTIGYGSDMNLWKDMMSTLRMIGYDGSVSIEHEDGMMSGQGRAGKKPSPSSKEVMITEQPAAMWACLSRKGVRHSMKQYKAAIVGYGGMGHWHKTAFSKPTAYASPAFTTSTRNAWRSPRSRRH